MRLFLLRTHFLVGGFPFELQQKSGSKTRVYLGPYAFEVMESVSDDGQQNDGLKSSSKRRDRLELLILSEAGKPIYSFSKREDIVTLMPLCSALINYANKVQKETLHSMRTSDNLMISFTSRSPLIIIVIHELNSYVDALLLVEQVEAQITSIITAKTLRSVFEERPTFDLKKLLYGSEKLIDSISSLSVSVPKLGWPLVQAFLAVTSSSANNSNATASKLLPTFSIMLPSRPHRVLIPIVTMPSGTRDTMHSILCDGISANSKNMVFSLLFRIILPNDESDQAMQDGSSDTGDPQDDEKEDYMNDANFRLITICNHHNKHKLQILDIHILLALLDGSKTQLSSVESLWMPVCLPRFNQDAFLHAYISYLNDMKNCLVLLSVDRDEFANCQKARNAIENKLDVLYKDSNLRGKIYYQMSPLVHPVLLQLQDKLVSNTLTGDELAEAQQKAQIYNSKLELYHARQLQFLWYQSGKQVLWWQRCESKSPSPILFYITRKMLQTSLKILWLKLSNDSVFLGWHVPSFQLYAQFDNTIRTSEATEVIQRITNWIKKEEDNFSIKDYR